MLLLTSPSDQKHVREMVLKRQNAKFILYKLQSHLSKYHQNLRPLRLQKFHNIFIQVTSGILISARTGCPAV
jgi:hypothetical protein